LLNLGPVTHFGLDAPATAITGSNFTVGISPLTATNKTAFGYTGPIHFSSSDGAATLPADYSFTSTDNGWRSFNVTLNTLGNQTITITDSANSSVTSSATINVVPCAATFTVNSDQDDNTCGTLRKALQFATNSTTINITLTAPATIKLNGSGLTVPPGVTLKGVCNNGAPGITLDGTGIAGDGLTLNGNSMVRGLLVTHFNGRQIKVSGVGNNLSCVATKK
jgi:hypothetical protein